MQIVRMKKKEQVKGKILQEQYTEQYVQRNQEILERRVETALREAKKRFRDKNYPQHKGWQPGHKLQRALKEQLSSILFSEKAKVIKAFLTAHQRSIDTIKKNYQREINYSKNDKYVLGEYPKWMMQDEKIVENLKRFSPTLHILNYLWNLNRFTRGQELKNMFALTKKVAGEIQHKPKKRKSYNYATFVANTEFYKKMSSRIRCSTNYIQKCFIAFRNIGILKKLGTIARNETLYADGYYVPYLDSFRKEVFLKNTKLFREGLRNFNPLKATAKEKIKRKYPHAKR